MLRRYSSTRAHVSILKRGLVGSPCWWLVDLATYKKYLHRACGNSFSTVPREWEDGEETYLIPYVDCRRSRQQRQQSSTHI